MIYICNCYFQVGAGLPVIASVTRIVASGDPISRIVGSLSGMQLLVYYAKGRPVSKKITHVFLHMGL